jgi:hypothetical protein
MAAVLGKRLCISNLSPSSIEFAIQAALPAVAANIAVANMKSLRARRMFLTASIIEVCIPV